MRRLWAIARLDLAVWCRTPWVIATALVPPVAMYVLISVLSLAVTEQPVALVVNDPAPQAHIIADLIQADAESYQLEVTDDATARDRLETQKVAAIIEIPAGFD